MNTLSVEINFEDDNKIEIHPWIWSQHTLNSWRLSSGEVSIKFDFKWNALWAKTTITPEKFLELVGHNEEEAINIILDKNSRLSKEKIIEKHITSEVKEFYKLLETNKLISVDLKLTDQS